MKFESLHTSIHLGIDTKCVCTYKVCKPSRKLQLQDSLVDLVISQRDAYAKRYEDAKPLGFYVISMV